MYVHKGVLAGGVRGAEPPGGKIADLFTFTRIFHARRRGGTPPASDASCVSAVERPREGLPCRPPGRLRAGAPLQPASWPHHLSSLLSNKLFPFIRAAAVGRSRPAESSTSLFDRLGVTSSTGTSQVSSAQRIPRRAAALLEKIAAFGPAAFLSVRSFLLPRRRRASSGLRSRWSVMEPAALLVLVCCQPQLPASSSSSLSKLLPPSWQWMHAAAGLQGPRPACSTSLATRAPQALCKQAARSASLAAQRRF